MRDGFWGSSGWIWTSGRWRSTKMRQALRCWARPGMARGGCWEIAWRDGRRVLKWSQFRWLFLFKWGGMMWYVWNFETHQPSFWSLLVLITRSFGYYIHYIHYILYITHIWPISFSRLKMQPPVTGVFFAYASATIEVGSPWETP